MENTFVLDVNSPAMESAVKSLDMMLKRCLNQLMEGNFEGGEITLKLDVNVEPSVEWFPTVDKYTGENTSTPYEYRKPSIKHMATMQLKQKDECSGAYTGKVEIKEIDGDFVVFPVFPIEDRQTRLF